MGQLRILPERLQCDYYDWLNGKNGASCEYHGEYMTQYGWSEWTHGCLETERLTHPQQP